MVNQINLVGVLGAGTMGAGIAQAFASFGINVVLRDIEHAFVERGLATINSNLDRLVAKGKLATEEKQAIADRVMGTTEVSALADCDLIVEAAIEDMKIKKIIFAELDTVCKTSTILASNTSSLSITEIASATARPDQVIGMHFFNPAPVMKLVEIIRGIATSQTTVDAVMTVAALIDKQPVEVAEAPGFVVNRILVPMINEAVGILADGVADAQDIDDAMKLGANHPMGPLTLGDLIGLDVCLAVMDVLYQEFGDSKYRAHPLLRKYVRAGWLGRKSGKGFYNY
jgi:3-hydroxybutyryl-CoA dehydrogenase